MILKHGVNIAEMRSLQFAVFGGEFTTTIPALCPSKGVCADDEAGADAAADAAGADPPDAAADAAANAPDDRSARRWAGCNTPGNASAGTWSAPPLAPLPPCDPTSTDTTASRCVSSANEAHSHAAASA